MLRLERMQISGFKSFYDRTDARFPGGITAVVGPNGCGKSNIGDALNWVLGEQSPKNLRGKQMLDVIFNGSERRKPKGMAEVSLHLKRERAPVDSDAAEIVITRRLFRSGESEYLLDGKRTRLKDIQDLLRNEHVGAKTYATIEQGRIDQILNAKPKERRQIIEDAAGVSGFKHKRRLADLKLEATHANLLRVNDIVTEVARQIGSLKRQAAKARRYHTLREQHRERERVLFGARAAEIEGRLAGLRQREAVARDDEAAAVAALARTESSLEEERRALESLERRHREESDALHQVELEIDREESRIRHARERAGEAERLASRTDEECETLARRASELDAAVGNHAEVVRSGAVTLEALDEELGRRQRGLEDVAAARDRTRSEIEAVRRELFDAMNAAAESRNRLRALEEAIARAGADRARLERERGEARDDLDRLAAETDGLGREVETHQQALARLEAAHREATAEWTAARTGLADAQERLSKAREAERSAAAQLRTLEDVATRFAGESDGVRMLLTSGRESGLRTHGVVADFVEAVQDVEGVAETYLQSLLPAVILDGAADARHAVDLLRSSDAGRTSFVCKDQPAGALAVGTPANGSAPVPEAVLADPRVIGRLQDRLRLDTAMNGVVQDRIGDAILVDRLETALELHREHPGVDYLTRDGEIVYASGLVSAGGRARSDRGLLAHNRRIHETRASLAACGAELASAEAAVAEAHGRLSRAESRVTEVRSELEHAGRRRVELDLREQRSREDLHRTGRRADVLDAELTALSDEDHRRAAERVEIHREAEQAESRHQALSARIEEDGVRLEAVETSLRDATEEVADLRARRAAQRQAHEAAEREHVRLAESLAEVRQRIADARREADEARERAWQAAQAAAAGEQAVSAHVADRERRTVAVRDSAETIERLREALAAREGELRGVRARLDALRETAQAAELERSRAESDRSHLEELALREIGIGASDAAALAADALAAPDLDLAALSAEVADLRDRIERMGPVNMMAIDEFAELEERHAFLSTQKDDLERSMASLRETIRKINRESRQRFVEAFEAIRANYQEMFRVLFNGGRADLRLEDEEDVLESGIEILAQPPGKRLGSIQLMSGGEKAMSAIALLFAIFRYQPSPFCLLDEVDAPLDDVNVGRFTRMLREYADQTQFIMITHNKLSMDSANLLYGVTMEEPGVSRLVSLAV